ncbi:MAG TPA: mechanosensitive ion channel [Nitrospirales bacterium]|nr:mechanosensitive ion channel protein MscS [Nitrospiraceae bacterium]HNP29256.1 mechanosensitive ion channel [Nitrospirales bacterium]
MDLSTVVKTLDHFFTYPLFTINQTPITLSSLAFFVFIMAIFWMMNTLIRRFLGNKFLKHSKMPRATQYTLTRIIQYVLLLIGTIIGFQVIGVDLSGLAVIFGFLSVGIGFGLQNLTSNFIAGLMLLFEQHIQVGDRITVGDTEGDVAEINIRSTTIRSLNNVAIVVPNSEFISSTVTNWSHGDPKTRLEIEVGVSYNSNLDMVLKSLLEAAKEHPMVLPHPEPKAWLMSFGDSAWNMRLLVWVGDPQGRRQVQSDINCAIVTKFRKNGVEIPFPQRDLHLRTPLPLPISSTGT